MIKKVFGNAHRVILISCLFTAIYSFKIQAQKNISPTVSNSNPAANKSLSPKDILENKLRKSLKNPPEYVANLSEFINKYPYSERATSYLYSLARITKDVEDANDARNLVNQLIKNTEQTPVHLKGEIYRRSADILLNKGFYEDSAKLAQRAIELFDDTAYLEFKKKQHEVTMTEIAVNNPDYKTRPFDTERTKGIYLGTKTDIYNLLGQSLWEQGKFVQAEKAYRDSYAIKKNKDAALGIAKAAEKNGKVAEALKFAANAALSGRLEPTEMDYFYTLYAKQHQGKADGAEEYLDTEYKKTYSNPIKGEKYKPTSKRTDRAVLAEFFTGAGCIPCLPVDYMFETALEDYSSKEMVLLVYHWHAPVWDPLGNYSSDSRAKYYGINGAPSVFIDGKKSDKEGDYNGSDGEQNEIQEIAEGLNEEIRQNLEIPAEADLKLKTKRSGQTVKVEVTADRIKNVSDDVTLQIALVENEATYSGENGLRFHPLVVRALAGDNDKRNYGFKIDPSKANKFDYVFDVDKIIAQNGSYYETFPIEKMKEFAGRFGGNIPEGLKVEFKYKKNQIDAKNLSVIAFLQDNKTKKVLQSSWINLASK